MVAAVVVLMAEVVAVPVAAATEKVEPGHMAVAVVAVKPHRVGMVVHTAAAVAVAAIPGIMRHKAEKVETAGLTAAAVAVAVHTAQMARQVV